MASSDVAEAEIAVPECENASDPAYVLALEAEVAGLHERVDRLERERDRAEQRLTRRRRQLRETRGELDRTREWARFLESELNERDEPAGLFARVRSWLTRR